MENEKAFVEMSTGNSTINNVVNAEDVPGIYVSIYLYNKDPKQLLLAVRNELIAKLKQVEMTLSENVDGNGLEKLFFLAERLKESLKARDKSSCENKATTENTPLTED